MSFELPIFDIKQYLISQRSYMKIRNGQLTFIEDTPTGTYPVEFSIDRLYEDREYYVNPKGKLFTKPTILVGDIKFIRVYQGKPEFSYNGKTYSGYHQMSYAIYGYYDPEIKFKLSFYIWNDFDIKKIKFKEWRNHLGNNYPVYSYGQEIIKGMKGLRNRFPLQDKKVFEDLIEKVPKEKERHEELIHRYNIRVEDDQIKATRNGVPYKLRNMSHLQETLRSWNETVSHSTKKKLSEVLGI